MKQFLYGLCTGLVVALALFLVIRLIPQEQTAEIDNSSFRNISINSGDTVSFPLTITGEARGNMFFEGSFPIYIEDGHFMYGTGYAQAQGDWMTTDFVPFSATLTLSESYKGKAGIILSQDDPSDGESGKMPVILPIPVIIK